MLRRITVQPFEPLVESASAGSAWIFETIVFCDSWSYGIARAASTTSRCSATPCSRARLDVVTPSAWTTMLSTPMMPTSSTTAATRTSMIVKPSSQTERGQPWAARAYHGTSYFGRGRENLRVCTAPSTNVHYQVPLLQPPPGPEQLR